MKKFLSALLLLAILFLHTPSVVAKSINLDGQYSFYVKTYYNDENCTTVKNGGTFIVTCDSSHADALRRKLKNIVGESVSVKCDREQAEKTARELGASFESIGETSVAEGFNARFGGGVMRGNEKVNFQVAFADGTLTVGTPLILGGF